MILTVVEGMRLRNRLKALMQGSRYMQTVYGVTKIDGTEVNIPGTTIRFNEFADKKLKLLQLSEELNARLTEHNQSKGIYKIVDALQNKKEYLSLLNSAIPHCKASSSKTWIVVGSDRKQTETQFTPFINASDLKAQVKQLRQEMRSLQAELDKLDNTTIEVSFNEDVVDELEIAE